MNGTRITQRQRAVVLLLVQAGLVLSVAGKYFYERKTCPRVWVRTAQVDPNLPLRGRYLALRLTADGCGLPRDAAHRLPVYVPPHTPARPDTWRWQVTLHADAGRSHSGHADAGQAGGGRAGGGGLVASLEDTGSERDGAGETVQGFANRPCDRVTVSPDVAFFLSDGAEARARTKPGQELWVEVTVPPAGPPRPIQVAVSDGSTWTPVLR